MPVTLQYSLNGTVEASILTSLLFKLVLDTLGGSTHFLVHY